MTEQRDGKPAVFLAIIVVLGGLVVLVVLGTPLLLIAVQAAREAAQRERAENVLNQLEKAMHNYHQSQNPPRSADNGADISPEVPVDDTKKKAMETIQNTRLYRSLSEGRADVEIWDDNYTEDGWAYFSIVAFNDGTARKLEYIRVQDDRIQKRTYDVNGDDLWIAVE